MVEGEVEEEDVDAVLAEEAAGLGVGGDGGRDRGEGDVAGGGDAGGLESRGGGADVRVESAAGGEEQVRGDGRVGGEVVGGANAAARAATWSRSLAEVGARLEAPEATVA